MEKWFFRPELIVASCRLSCTSSPPISPPTRPTAIVLSPIAWMVWIRTNCDGMVDMAVSFTRAVCWCWWWHSMTLKKISTSNERVLLRKPKRPFKRRYLTKQLTRNCMERKPINFEIFINWNIIYHPLIINMWGSQLDNSSKYERTVFIYPFHQPRPIEPTRPTNLNKQPLHYNSGTIHFHSVHPYLGGLTSKKVYRTVVGWGESRHFKRLKLYLNYHFILFPSASASESTRARPPLKSDILAFLSHCDCHKSINGKQFINQWRFCV